MTIQKIFLRTAHNYDRDAASNEHGLKCEDPSLAQQQFKEECDINTIADRYGLTGEVPQLTQLPSFGDFTGVFDYQTAMNAVVKGRETFMELPAKLRARFHNDPQEFLEFCSDKDNLAEAQKLGILKPLESTSTTEELTDETRNRRPAPQATQDDTRTTRTQERTRETPPNQGPRQENPRDDR